MNGFWQFFKTAIQHQAVQFFIVIGTVAIALANIWIGLRTAPLADHISTIATQVDADNRRITNLEDLTPQFIKLQQQLQDISPRLDRIENKVDSIDNFLRGYK